MSNKSLSLKQISIAIKVLLKELPNPAKTIIGSGTFVIILRRTFIILEMLIYQIQDLKKRIKDLEKHKEFDKIKTSVKKESISGK